MGYAFISYSSDDAKIASKLKNILNNNQINTWIAPDDIPVGSKYAKVINNAIKNCSCFVLLLSNKSQNSTWVEKELERAIHYEKPIIPIKLEDVTLNDEFEFYISTDQIIDIRDFSENNPQILSLCLKIKACTANSPFEKHMLADVVETAVESKKKTIKPVYIIIAACLCVIILLSIILASKNNGEDEETPTPTATQTLNVTETPTATQNVTETNAPATATPQPVGENQIPKENEADITALKHADFLKMQTSTVYVKVGEYVTPTAATVWNDVTIYSENTAIAVGEGMLVKGIAPGETYVLIKTRGSMTAAYRVIVE